MGQISFSVSLILIALFSIAIIGFAVNFGIDNDAYVQLSDDPELTNLYAEQRANMTSLREQSESTYTSIVESSIEEGETTPTGGQFSITPGTLLSTISNIVKVGYLKIFGSGEGFGIFLTTFILTLLFIMSLYIWKTWVGRNPD